MENEEGVKVDLYIPRKCSATSRLIPSDDHASIQVNVAHVDENGKMIPGKYTTYALCGYIRKKGVSDHSLNKIASKGGFLKNVLAPSLVL